MNSLMGPQNALKDRLAKRLLRLLEREEDPVATMRWAERRLEEAGLLESNPPEKGESRSAWVHRVIVDNWQLAEGSLWLLVDKGLDPFSLTSAGQLILELIPMEGDHG